MKYVEFKASDTIQFNLFYAAIKVVCPPGVQGVQLDKDGNIKHAKVMSYIESVARKPVDGDDVYNLPEGMGLILSLEDEHYNLVKRIIDGFPFNPKFTRELSGIDGEGGLYKIVDNPLKELPKPIVEDGEAKKE